MTLPSTSATNTTTNTKETGEPVTMSLFRLPPQQFTGCSPACLLPVFCSWSPVRNFQFLVTCPLSFFYFNFRKDYEFFFFRSAGLCRNTSWKTCLQSEVTRVRSKAPLASLRWHMICLLRTQTRSNRTFLSLSCSKHKHRLSHTTTDRRHSTP
jgi:hypothetical protein